MTTKKRPLLIGSCGNCKWWETPWRDNDYGHCGNIDFGASDFEGGTIYTKEDFGCVGWEGK